MAGAVKFGRTAVALALAAGACLAQEVPDLDTEDVSDALAQSLEYFQSHPVNLNRATPDEIAGIPLLYPLEALALARYLRVHPGLRDPSALVRDSVIEQRTLDDILPYICLDAPPARTSPAGELRSVLQQRFPADGGSAADPYQGSALAVRQKISVRRGPWELTALTQKDPGERSIADFASVGMSYSPRGAVTFAVAGDYQLSYGQGLAFGGSSPRFLSARSGGPSGGGTTMLRANHSFAEWSSLRGGAVSAAVGKGGAATVFASVKPRDGRIDSAGSLAAVDNAGYHRDRGELDRRDAFRERIGGVRLEHQTLANLRLAVSGYGVACRPDLPDGERIRPGVSVDGCCDLPQGQVFWEAVAPRGRRPAVIAGGRAQAGAVRTHLTLRWYGPDFAAPRTNAAGSASRDERGLTFGAGWRAPLATTVFALVDHWQPVSVARALERGHGGFFIETVVANQPLPGFSIEWRWRRRQAEAVSADPRFPFPSERRTASRVGLRWRVERRLSLSTKYEVCRTRREGDAMAPRGDLLTAAVDGAPDAGWRVAVSTAFFTVDDYDARLYGTEPELSGSGSFHPLYGRGRRDALMVSYGHRAQVILQAKLARQQRNYRGEVVRQTEAGLAVRLAF